MVELMTMEDLENAINLAIDKQQPMVLLIQMEGFEYPELITNPYQNLSKKLDYYKKAYNNDLKHKHSKGIKIIGYKFA